MTHGNVLLLSSELLLSAWGSAWAAAGAAASRCCSKGVEDGFCHEAGCSWDAAGSAGVRSTCCDAAVGASNTCAGLWRGCLQQQPPEGCSLPAFLQLSPACLLEAASAALLLGLLILQHPATITSRCDCGGARSSQFNSSVKPPGPASPYCLL